MPNILVIYHSYPLRATIVDHLYAFGRYAPHRVFYINLATRRLPTYLLKIPLDLIVFHTTFLSLRAWNPPRFHQLLEKASRLRQLKVVKIALPQDEFINTDLLCDFINEFDIRYVFSVMPPSEWPKIYHKVDRSKTIFLRVLTGYLEEGTIARITRLAQVIPDRTIDIGYRAWRAEPWLGRHGALKAQIAEVFQEHTPRKGLLTDISTRNQDVLVGDAWYQFLLKCKYTLGVEGGASILDRDGTIKQKTEEYIQCNPHAGFEELELCCFPGIDGSARLLAISPRHLEACATCTCQVLIEGKYNDILKPGVHYIELKRDYSNLEEVLEIIKQDALRAEITKRAYKDIVESKLYTYRNFVDFIINHSLQNIQPQPSSLWTFLIWKWTQFNDLLSLIIIHIRSILFYKLVLKLPGPVRSKMRQFMYLRMRRSRKV